MVIILDQILIKYVDPASPQSFILVVIIYIMCKFANCTTSLVLCASSSFLFFFWFVTALNCQNHSSHTWSLYRPPSVWNSHVWRAAKEEEARSPHPCAYQSLKCQSDDGQSVCIDNTKWKDTVKRWQSLREWFRDVTACADATSLPPSTDNVSCLNINNSSVKEFTGWRRWFLL